MSTTSDFLKKFNVNQEIKFKFTKVERVWGMEKYRGTWFLYMLKTVPKSGQVELQDFSVQPDARVILK